MVGSALDARKLLEGMNREQNNHIQAKLKLCQWNVELTVIDIHQIVGIHAHLVQELVSLFGVLVLLPNDYIVTSKENVEIFKERF